MWIKTLLLAGILYAGSSITKGTGSPLNMVFFNNKPDRTATIIPVTYRLIITKAALSGKKAAVIMP
jgi:hypothetical protein